MTHAARTSRGRGRGAHQSGMTLLETILAVVLLALITASMANVVAYLSNSLKIQRIRLAQAEVAHSLLIQYVDNKNEMPPDSLPIGYGNLSFRWALSVDNAEITQSDAAQAVEAESTNSSPMKLRNRMKVVTTTVWLGEASGGSMRLQEGVPTVSMSRLVDPFAFKNPDGTTRYLDGEGGMQQLLRDFMDSTGSTLDQTGTTP